MSVLIASCNQEVNTTKLKPLSQGEQQEIIEETMRNAYQHDLYSQEFQSELDKGLAQDATIAYLWQQKSMPLYKQGKYEFGRPFLDKAVLYNRQRYLDYRAFMTCIFQKNYREAIVEFEKCIEEYGNSHVMDHTYKCYMGISYLMLNEFTKAENIFHEDMTAIAEEHGEDWVHHLELFYYGISLFEQAKYEEAIVAFNRALEKYPNFSDVQYYQALSYARSDQLEKAREVMALAAENAQLGNTINEDNVIYERYPYQVRLNTYKKYESR